MSDDFTASVVLVLLFFFIGVYLAYAKMKEENEKKERVLREANAALQRKVLEAEELRDQAYAASEESRNKLIEQQEANQVLSAQNANYQHRIDAIEAREAAIEEREEQAAQRIKQASNQVRNAEAARKRAEQQADVARDELVISDSECESLRALLKQKDRDNLDFS